ncbi:MAG: antibiotic biosynthesis monooxygenase [Campylobacterales bacterium]|nr:antibiotic biosynthesis monooxygenase [Campylobacterales bacterium]
MIEKKVELTAKESTVQELEDLLKHVVEESLKEEGCEVFNLFKIKDTRTFVVMEKWSDNKFLEAHRLTPHYIKLKNSLDDITEGEKSSLEIIRL